MGMGGLPFPPVRKTVGKSFRSLVLARIQGSKWGSTPTSPPQPRGTPWFLLQRPRRMETGFSSFYWIRQTLVAIRVLVDERSYERDGQGKHKPHPPPKKGVQSKPRGPCWKPTTALEALV